MEAGFDRRESQGSQGAGSPPASPFGGREGGSTSKSMASGAKAGDAGRGEPANPRPPSPERVGIQNWLLREERAGGCRGRVAPQFPPVGGGGGKGVGV